MSEKIKTDAVLCALPDDLIQVISTSFKNAGVQTMDAHNHKEMLALLQSHTFKGMVTVSSWLPENEMMGRVAPSISEILTLILIEPRHQNVPIRLISLENPNHDWVTLPFDLDELHLRAKLLGLLPET